MDQEAGVWVAESTNLPGLVTEAETAELLLEKLRLMVPELLSYSPDWQWPFCRKYALRYYAAIGGPRRGLMADYADPVRERCVGPAVGSIAMAKVTTRSGCAQTRDGRSSSTIGSSRAIPPTRS